MGRGGYALWLMSWISAGSGEVALKRGRDFGMGRGIGMGMGTGMGEGLV